MNENTTFSYETRFGRLDFAYNSPFWISEIDGASSVDVDIYESQSVGQVGTSTSGRSVRSRSIPISGSIFDPVMQNREILIAAIAPGIPATLTVTQNGKAWYLDVEPEKTPNITAGNGVQMFQVRLKAAYPYWRSVEHNNQLLFGLEALFEFPFYTGGEWYISRLKNGFAYVENTGNVPIPFRAEFSARGIVENPQLYNVDTGKRFLVTRANGVPYVMEAGERIIISTVYGERGSTIIKADGTVINGFRYMTIDSDWNMQITPGITTLQASASAYDNNLDVHIDVPKGVRSGV